MSNHKNLSSTKYYLPNTKSGFTLVEMLIVAPMIILVIGVFIGAIINMTGEVMMTRGSGSVTYSIQDALDRIEEDVKTSGAFLATNNITLSPGQGYNDGNGTDSFKNASTTNGNMLILNSYATTNNPTTSSLRNISYMAGPYSCNSALLNQNSPVMINIVYFVKNDILYRRTIMPDNYLTVGCNGGSVGSPWQKPSCAHDYTATFCKAEDIKLVEGVDPTTGFEVEYHSSPSSNTPNATASNPNESDGNRQTSLRTTNTVKVTINAINNIAGREVNQSGTLRAVSQNNNTFVTPKIYPVQVVVVAGGGGGANTGSGGGAGGYVYNSTLYLTPGTYIATVGGGGAGGGPQGSAVAGIKGSDSKFSIIVAEGGGQGYSHGSCIGGDGGSGGGGPLSTTCTAVGGLGSQGNAGGAGLLDAGWLGGSGGGGGAGGAGSAGSKTQGISGNGGVGIVNPISGSISGQNVSGTYYLAGGGGGSEVNSNTYVGTGGYGGGGSAGVNVAGGNGTANTGGGGGGGAYNAGVYTIGGNGGSGIIIIRYPTSLMTASGGTITYPSGYTIHTFTTVGNTNFVIP